MPDVQLPRVRVRNSFMAYRAMGERSNPVAVFLHGNPTSSFIWRNIMPTVATVARCIAPDLIGFGQSGKPDIPYLFADHVAYLDGFLAEYGIDEAYIVAQDWGTALAFELAARRPLFVRGLAFMEFIRPMQTWDEFHQVPQAREAFRRFRTPDVGEQLILRENAFVEKILPGSIHRGLSREEMSIYRAPFPDEKSRIPTLRFPNELPIEGRPREVAEALAAAHAALKASIYPKLLFVGNPGALVSPEYGRQFASTLKNCEMLWLESGMHYLQEDQPQAIADGVAQFILRSEASREARHRA